MSRSVGLAHIVRQSDGTSNGVWGLFSLKSAFQPIFAFHDGKLEIVAFEGLLRPFRDGQGMSPGAFFNSVSPQDRLHVETLSRTLHLLNAGACLDKRARIFVNFDPSVFVEPSVAQTALRDMRLVLHEASIDPERIVCEITEQKTSSQSGLHMFVAALREHGYAIAIDDYGAEESGIERINALHPDIVKFDAHWITHLMRSGPGYALLEAMVAEFEGRGIATLFEGIEEPWQLELAEKCGTSMVQGFVLARPQLAPTEFGIFSAEQDPAAAPAETKGADRVAEARPAAPAAMPPTPVARTGTSQQKRTSWPARQPLAMIASADISKAISADEVGIRTGRFGPLTLRTTVQPVYRRVCNELRLAALIGGTRFLIAGRDGGAATIEQLPADQRERAAEMGRQLAVLNRGNVGIDGVPLVVRAGSTASGVSSIIAASEAETPFGEADPARLICELSASNKLSPDDFAKLSNELRRSNIGISVGGFAGSPADIEAVRAAGPEIVSIDSRWFGRVAAMAEAARLLPVLFDSLRASGALVHVGALDDSSQLAAAIAAGADLVSGAALAQPMPVGSAIDRTVIPLDRAARSSGEIIPLFA